MFTIGLVCTRLSTQKAVTNACRELVWDSDTGIQRFRFSCTKVAAEDGESDEGNTPEQHALYETAIRTLALEMSLTYDGAKEALGTYLAGQRYVRFVRLIGCDLRALLIRILI